MSFIEKIELDTIVENNIIELGFKNPTPIQQKAIPLILEGNDIAGLAQTGTGKTAAYLLPLLHKVLSAKNQNQSEFSYKKWQKGNFILVLVPTRELTDQVLQAFNGFVKGTSLKGVAVFGGGDIERQKRIINQGVDFVFATPGRLIDLYKSHSLDLNNVRAVVFDEADRMFDMGFKDDMKYLLRRIPSERQFLLFSATLDFEVLNVAYEFDSHPIELNISKDQLQTDNVKAEIFHIAEDEKPSYLLSILNKYKPKNAVIFTNYKNQIQLLVEFLKINNVPALGISSLLRQSQRLRVIEKIKNDNSEINILVGTDVAARGLDIKGVDLVINYDLPSHAEVYVHRIGRTGRADSEGLAFNLSCEKDVEALQRIEEFLGEKITIGWLEDSDLIKEFVSMDEVKKKVNKKRKPSSHSNYKKKGVGKKKKFNSKKKATTSESGENKKFSKKKYSSKKSTSKKRKTYSTSSSVAKKSTSSPKTKSTKSSTSIGTKVKSFLKKLIK